MVSPTSCSRTQLVDVQPLIQVIIDEGADVLASLGEGGDLGDREGDAAQLTERVLLVNSLPNQTDLVAKGRHAEDIGFGENV